MPSGAGDRMPYASAAPPAAYPSGAVRGNGAGNADAPGRSAPETGTARLRGVDGDEIATLRDAGRAGYRSAGAAGPASPATGVRALPERRSPRLRTRCTGRDERMTCEQRIMRSSSLMVGMKWRHETASVSDVMRRVGDGPRALGGRGLEGGRSGLVCHAGGGVTSKKTPPRAGMPQAGQALPDASGGQAATAPWRPIHCIVVIHRERR